MRTTRGVRSANSFRVQGLRLGFGSESRGLFGDRAWSLGFRVHGLNPGILGPKRGVGVKGSGFQVWGEGLWGLGLGSWASGLGQSLDEVRCSWQNDGA